MEDVYDEGYDAYWNGKELIDNPYGFDLKSKEEWSEGWHDAQYDATHDDYDDWHFYDLGY